MLARRTRTRPRFSRKQMSCWCPDVSPGTASADLLAIYGRNFPAFRARSRVGNGVCTAGGGGDERPLPCRSFRTAPSRQEP